MCVASLAFKPRSLNASTRIFSDINEKKSPSRWEMLLTAQLFNYGWSNTAFEFIMTFWRFVIFQFRSTDERDKSMHDQYEQLTAFWFVRLKALYRNSLIYNNNDNLYHLILRTKLDHFVTVVKNELNSFLNILWRMAFVLKLYNVPFLYL